MSRLFKKGMKIHLCGTCYRHNSLTQCYLRYRECTMKDDFKCEADAALD